MERHREIETKLDPGGETPLPDLTALEGVADIDVRELRLEAVYFDTDALALAAAGISLRRRSGGVDDGWYLKLPARDGERLELHEPLGDGDEPVPEALVDALQLFVRDGAPSPVVRLRTRRAAHRLLDAEGRALLEVAD
ncbi:CYTH domain-containing protein, partial [Agrococcus sp. HG114]|uniref:CYTH domain-containing protein n=1 Tax=Agrococcus sp. HG114 TaxID=2969757 RepID=UPI00215B5110